MGFGAIGQKVAKIAQAFSMNVLAFNRSKKQADNVTFVDLDTLLKDSDIVTVHCPLNKDSENLFDKTAFNKTESVAETAEASSHTETTETKAMENTEQHGIITDDDDLEIMTLPQTESVEDTQALTEETYEVTTAPALAETKPAERETYIELPFVPAV